jgi:hypothetical protein
MYTYEFTLHQNGTFFYHSHDAMQEGIGMVGLFVIHPKEPHEPRVDRDFALVSQEWAVLPGATIPNTMSMEFNLFTFTGRSGPYVTPLVCMLVERILIRFVNLSPSTTTPSTSRLYVLVTGTEGVAPPNRLGFPVTPSSWGGAAADRVRRQQRGRLALHCHMFHHMMNFMSTMIGPMGGHTVQGMRAGQSPTGGMGIATGGPALSSEAFGPSLGRSMGEQTGMDRTVGNMTVMPPGGGHGMGHSAGGRRVPGSPVGMLDMPVQWSEEQIRKLNQRETRGMRADWYTGVEGCSPSSGCCRPSCMTR